MFLFASNLALFAPEFYGLKKKKGYSKNKEKSIPPLLDKVKLLSFWWLKKKIR